MQNLDYPYGEFPTRFTKNGQQKLIEQLKSGEREENVKVQATPVQETTNNFDMAKLLPLIKMMGDKKSMSQSDMLQMMLPLLGGGSQMADMMSLLFKDNKSQEEKAEDIEVSSFKIDDFKKIE